MPRRTPGRNTRSRSRRSTRGKGSTTPAPVRRQAVIYARVSSREQEREGYSIPAQLDLLRAYADEQSFDVVQEYTDVETAKRTGRTAFGKMLTFLRKKRKVQPVVLVEKTDRLYRNLKDWVSVDALKVDVHLVKEGVVLSDESRSSEKFVHGIKVLMAKNYVDNLSEEVRKGMHHKAADGYWPSSAPIGYLNKRENGRSRLILDPDRAMMVRLVFELYDTGEWSMNRIAKHVTAEGFRGKRGGKITASQIQSILRKSLYAGRFEWGGEVYDGKDPRIIDWALYERVQDRMEGHPYTRPEVLEFAYGSGLLTCGHCGAAITAEKKKQKYIYYRCSQRCEAHAFIREEDVCAQYLQHFRALNMTPDVAQRITDTLRLQHGEVEIDIRKRMNAAHGRVEKYGRLIEAAYEDKLEGNITTEFFHEKRTEWERLRREAARDIERLARVSQKTLDQALQLIELARCAHGLLSQRTPLEQRDLLEMTLSNSFLTGKVLTVEWRRPFDVLASRPEPPENENGPGLGDPGRLAKWSGRQDSNLRPSAPKATSAGIRTRRTL